MKKIFTPLLILSSLNCFSQSTTVVISQAYGGGGGSTGTYKPDYVELHNVSNTVQSLDGFSLQYGSATGNFGASSSNIYAFASGISIPAGGYFLVQLGSLGSGGVDLPVTPDVVTTNLNMSAASGKVALANQAASLGCGATGSECTIPASAIIDLVAWGASNNAEGGSSVNNGVALTSTQGCVRKTNGCTETNNNNNDFDVVTAPVPRNSASPVVICGGSSPNLVAGTLSDFGNVCTGTTTGPNSFTISGSNLTTANVTVAALPGFTYSTSSGGTYTSTLGIAQPGGSFTQDIFVKFSPTAVQSYNGNISVAGGGVSTPTTVAATGSGVGNTIPFLTTGPTTSVTAASATLAGFITATGCSGITSYGIEYSTTNGFPNGSGIAVPSSNLSAGSFSSNVSGLISSTSYYYHAYAVNTTGTGYGSRAIFCYFIFYACYWCCDKPGIWRRWKFGGSIERRLRGIA